MTEAERAFEAWFRGEYCTGPHGGEFSVGQKKAFLAGLRCGRPKAKPLVTCDVVKYEYPRLSHDYVIAEWAKKNDIPEDTKIKVTVEEV